MTLVSGSLQAIGNDMGLHPLDVLRTDVEVIDGARAHFEKG